MNWLKYTKVYYLVSLLLVVICVLSIVNWGFKVGIDFSGGTVIEYRIENNFDTGSAVDKLSDTETQVSSIQKTSDGTYIFKLNQIASEKKVKFEAKLEEITGSAVDELKFEVVGPSVGPELIKKTVYALVIAVVLILLWVAVQFKDAGFGAAAIIAMLHDTFILVGSFSILGHFFGAEVDFLFVTAVLTTLSFSVHDTIVVFDRIREIKRKSSGDELVVISNRALTETFVRSLNNSFTIIFMLVALLLLGGATIKWFAAALLIGTVLGTYSSPFVAVPLLNLFHNLRRKIEK